MKLNWAERWPLIIHPSHPTKMGNPLFRKKSDLPAGLSFWKLVAAGGPVPESSIGLPAEPSSFGSRPEMIRKAEDYLSFKTKADRFLTADVLNLPYGNASFDAVFGFGVLHHVPDWQSALGEISRVLKARGTYFLEELYPGLYQTS